MIEGRDRRQYVEWKLPPDDRRRERDIFGRAKAIKPSNQAVLQRCRDNEGRSVVEICRPSLSSSERDAMTDRVISSTNRGTPCALAMICSMTGSGSVTPAAVLLISSLACRLLSWLSVSNVAWPRPTQGGTNSGRKFAITITRCPATRFRIRPISSMDVASAQ